MLDTVRSAHVRQRNGGHGLVGKRIEIADKGRGTVVDVEARFGRSTRHVVQFDSGKREVLKLGKRGFSGKGYAFYVDLAHNDSKPIQPGSPAMLWQRASEHPSVGAASQPSVPVAHPASASRGSSADGGGDSFSAETAEVAKGVVRSPSRGPGPQPPRHTYIYGKRAYAPDGKPNPVMFNKEAFKMVAVLIALTFPAMVYTFSVAGRATGKFNTDHPGVAGATAWLTIGPVWAYRWYVFVTGYYWAANAMAATLFGTWKTDKFYQEVWIKKKQEFEQRSVIFQNIIDPLWSKAEKKALHMTQPYIDGEWRPVGCVVMLLVCSMSFIISTVGVYSWLYLLGLTTGECKEGLCKEAAAVGMLGVLSFAVQFFVTFGYLQWFYCSCAKEYLTCINIVGLLVDCTHEELAEHMDIPHIPLTNVGNVWRWFKLRELFITTRFDMLYYLCSPSLLNGTLLACSLMLIVVVTNVAFNKPLFQGPFLYLSFLAGGCAFALISVLAIVATVYSRQQNHKRLLDPLIVDARVLQQNSGPGYPCPYCHTVPDKKREAAEEDSADVPKCLGFSALVALVANSVAHGAMSA
eukprot:g579.t1